MKLKYNLSKDSFINAVCNKSYFIEEEDLRITEESGYIIVDGCVSLHANIMLELIELIDCIELEDICKQ